MNLTCVRFSSKIHCIHYPSTCFRVLHSRPLTQGRTAGDVGTRPPQEDVCTRQSPPTTIRSRSLTRSVKPPMLKLTCSNGSTASPLNSFDLVSPTSAVELATPPSHVPHDPHPPSVPTTPPRESQDKAAMGNKHSKVVAGDGPPPSKLVWKRRTVDSLGNYIAANNMPSESKPSAKSTHRT